MEHFSKTYLGDSASWCIPPNVFAFIPIFKLAAFPFLTGIPDGFPSLHFLKWSLIFRRASSFVPAIWLGAEWEDECKTYSLKAFGVTSTKHRVPAGRRRIPSSIYGEGDIQQRNISRSSRPTSCESNLGTLLENLGPI